MVDSDPQEPRPDSRQDEGDPGSSGATPASTSGGDQATALVRFAETDDTLTPDSQPHSGRKPRAPSASGESSEVAPHLRAPGEDPWDSLPAPESEPGSSGRQVLRVLTLPAWKHYRNLRFLAQGGMGRVFKAYDPTLKRTVALKFLRRDEPDLVARFSLEAQHQARIDHPNICRVYEVGEWQGQSYIAMQFLEGETLDVARLNLTRPEVVQIMETVAEAIHAAHRTGLIHRDLKPANIMVQRGEAGLTPAILDFGLARGHENQQLTQQGLAVGTLHYMAPEQAQSDHARIDRRTDVYGLGATLHKVLTGEPPFAAFDGMEVLRRTLEVEVPPLRRLVPNLPEDLDTITRKCLEKDPARRYPSALALAEDLRRWREGEPILARKPSLAYLTRVWIRRHRLVTAVAGAALVAVLALAGVAMATAASAQARARHAQHFGQEAERIEAMLRYAHLLPPHDVRPELAQARARMAALEAEARRVGPLAAGPAAYALGRGHLALGEVEPARQLLEQAWDSGLKGPEVSLALGRALAASYQRALDLARALPSRELRETREKELARDLRALALTRLREGASAALEAPAYHEALVAFMGGQWDQAQARARAALAATPWLFEAKRLEGEALLESAKALPSPVESYLLLQQAEAALADARRLGPSDPATALAEVRVLAEQVAQRLASGGQAEALLLRCREAVRRSRALQPDGGQAPANLARALIRWAELRPPNAPETRAALQEAAALSAEALRLSPEDPATLATRIPVLLVIGIRDHRARRMDPLPLYQEAQELARKALLRHPQEPLFPALLASACMRRMTWEINTGTPPWASFEEGLTQALALRDRFPDFVGGYQGLATLWVERAEYERRHGLDPRPSVVAALEALSAAARRGLRLRHAGWSEGDAYLIRAQYLLATQGGGEEDFRRATEEYQRALRDNPNLLQAHNALAEAALGRAQSRLELGQDPRPMLAEAADHFERMGHRSAVPDQTEYLKGQLALLRGRLRLASDGNPDPDWAQAMAAFRRAATQGGLAKTQLGLAEVLARAYRHRGRAQDRVQALAAARKALELDPLHAEAWLWIAVVEQEAARRGDERASARAGEAWNRALSLDANLRRTALSLGMP